MVPKITRVLAPRSLFYFSVRIGLPEPVAIVAWVVVTVEYFSNRRPTIIPLVHLNALLQLQDTFIMHFYNHHRLVIDGFPIGLGDQVGSALQHKDWIVRRHRNAGRFGDIEAPFDNLRSRMGWTQLRNTNLSSSETGQRPMKHGIVVVLLRGKNEWSGRVEGSMQRENDSDSGQQRSAGCFVHKYGQNNKVKNVVASLERDVSLQQSLPDQNFKRSSFW